MKAFTIGAVSCQPELWEPEKNLRQLLGLIDEAAQCGAQVIATPSAQPGWKRVRSSPLLL